MNVVKLFQDQADAQPEAEALVEKSGKRRRALTYRALEQQAARGAALLAQQGLRKGDAVLVLVPFSIELYVVLAALFRCGLVAMLLDPGQGRAHIKRCCRLYPPDAFIGTPKAHGLRLLVPAVRQIPRSFVVGGRMWGAQPWAKARQLQEAAVTPCEAGDPALLTFTSGSTGEPKAAVRTHGFLQAQHAALADALQLEAGQRDLTTLPVFALANLASGVTSILANADLRRPGSIQARPVLRQIRAEQPTRMAASPAFIERLLEEAEREYLRSLHRIDTGGAPVFPDLLDRLHAAMPEAELVAVYGSTEAEPIAELSYRELTDSARRRIEEGGGLPAGRPVDHITLRVVEDQWGTPLESTSAAQLEAITCLPGRPGEIVVAGDHVLPGYLGGHGDSESKFSVDGQRWHRTGDAGCLDSEGRLWLLGRCAAAVRDGKGTVYPLAVEAAARSILRPGVTAFTQYEGKRVLVVESASDLEHTTSTILTRLEWAQLDSVKLLPRIPVDARHNAKVDYIALSHALANKR